MKTPKKIEDIAQKAGDTPDADGRVQIQKVPKKVTLKLVHPTLQLRRPGVVLMVSKGKDGKDGKPVHPELEVFEAEADALTKRYPGCFEVKE